MIHLRSLAVGLLAATLAACSGESLPAKPLPPPSARSTPVTATASPSASTSAERKAEVEAAVRRYFADVNKAISTGDTKDLIADSTPTCPCRGIVTMVRADFSQGSDRGAGWVVSDVQVSDATTTLAHATGSYLASPYESLDHLGRVLKRFKGRRVSTAFVLARRGNRWVVANAFGLGDDVIEP